MRVNVRTNELEAIFQNMYLCTLARLSSVFNVEGVG